MVSRRDAHNLCGGDDNRHHRRHLHEPDTAIRAAGNRCDIACVRQGEPCYDTAGGDTCYRVRPGREPDITVWPGADRSHRNVCLLGSLKDRKITR